MASISVRAFDFQDKVIRATGDGQFSVYDVLVAFGICLNLKRAQEVYSRIGTANPEVPAKCGYLKFPGKGQRETPVASEEAMYGILMLCPGHRGAEFRSWAANILANPDSAADLAIAKYKRQGKSDQWIRTRLESKIGRKAFTDTLKEHGVNGQGYALCTDAHNKAIIGMTAADYKKQHGVKSVRDSLPTPLIGATILLEEGSMHKIKKDNAQGNRECLNACEAQAEKMKAFLKDFIE